VRPSQHNQLPVCVAIANRRNHDRHLIARAEISRADGNFAGDRLRLDFQRTEFERRGGVDAAMCGSQKSAPKRSESRSLRQRGWRIARELSNRIAGKIDFFHASPPQRTVRKRRQTVGSKHCRYGNPANRRVNEAEMPSGTTGRPGKSQSRPPTDQIPTVARRLRLARRLRRTTGRAQVSICTC